MSLKLAADAIDMQDHEIHMLMKTYNKHMNAIGSEEKGNYRLGNIKKVLRNIPERCFEVHYANGEWFKYYTNGTWG
ncbi:hypothetical protein [Gracilibacillus lacisalsi]|uniref:hypothetical protein n=1 Tax=Gracilibacillus lacisalsi TaxID=393087 RepID=UPI00036DC583|nr:hypothetical protein [Gracilibacillus lacisalsi]